MVSPRLLHWLWLAIFVGISGSIHNATQSFYDGDTGYHLAVARLMAEHGILHSFPWTPFSWLADHYADKELLFHLFLVPLAPLNPDLAARIAGSLLGAGLLATLYAILVRERVARAGWWALVPLAASSAFLHRFALIRPHMFAIPLALIIAWSSARERWLVLGVACFLFPLFYTAWHLPLVLIVIAEAARLASGERVRPRVIGLSLGAVACGVLLHPNFPENLRLFWIQNVTVLLDTAWSGKAGFELGGEFNPFSVEGLLRYVLLPALLATGGVALAWRQRKEDPAPLGLALTALAFLAITLRTQRFIEYLVPFAVLALALVVRGGPRRWLAPTLFGVGAIYLLAFGWHPIERLRHRINPFPPEVAESLRQLVPRGEQVVTCDWRLTGEMMLALPERRFMVALDPVFFAINDERGYRLWFDTIHEPPARPGEILRDAFAARFVLCDRRTKWLPFVQALDRDPDARLLGVVGYWVVFELLDSA